MQRRIHVVAVIAATLVVAWSLESNAAGGVDANQDGSLSAKELGDLFASGQGARDEVFNRADTNGDGKLSRAETKDLPDFDRIDANRDGSLSRTEFTAWRAQTVASGAQAADQNKDASLSTDEIGGVWEKGRGERDRRRADWKQQWDARDQADANQDGVLTDTEAVSRYNRGQGRRVQTFNTLDADHNKSLSKEEFPSDVFSKVDANGDQRITQSEYMEAHAVMTASGLDTLDADDDRTVTAEDLKRLLQQRK